MRYGNIYACMSWSWHSQSLRHVPRPKNIISSHSGILDAFVAASLCLAVFPCGSFVLVVESVGQALFNPYLLFIKKKLKKKNISVPGWYLHEFEFPLLRCRAVCLSSPRSMKDKNKLMHSFQFVQRQFSNPTVCSSRYSGLEVRMAA